MIYLDNAATSFPKPKSTYSALWHAIKFASGNAGRSSHKLAQAAADTIYNTREAIADLFHADSPEGVVFTYNATHALNMAIKSYVEEGAHVLISDIEHNAVIRPLEIQRERGSLIYDTFSTDGDIEANISSRIRPETTCIISTLQSNVTGRIIPADILSRVAEKYKLTLILDASQLAGHGEINLKRTPCDVLCAPGHKGLFGIQGVGFAIFRDLKRRKSFIEGGSGSDSIDPRMPSLLPEGYEAGTLGAPSIASLRGGVEYVKKRTVEEISEQIHGMTNRLIDRISSINEAELYPSGGGIVSFNLKGRSSSLIASMLDEKSICVRSGLHCAPSAHKKLGTLNRGTIRASLSCFTTVKELDLFYKSIRNICDEVKSVPSSSI
ncbi:MAG: aminotransferase class V-fold PLP-dependent enzyme [Clostridia bacterium]|nr:aminotransferase class V-fold PLP-dependent enzyme [Clostridia bacterium]